METYNEDKEKADKMLESARWNLSYYELEFPELVEHYKKVVDRCEDIRTKVHKYWNDLN